VSAAPAADGRQAGRVVIALGGNAIAPADRGGSAAEQIANISRSMALVADLIDAGAQVVLTHGNGPQVGNLLIKNELAADVVPAMPLDWCVAQTQATIGFVIATYLERELALREQFLHVVPIVSRVLVDAADPAFDRPTKPIGPWVADEAEALRRAEATGQAWAHAGPRGWRRVVPSPDPLRLLDLFSVRTLLDAGVVAVAAGGGGIPMVRDGDGRLRGVEAVVDKDLAGALLARELGAERFVILTDVPGVAVGYGGPDERWLGGVTVPELRALAEQGQFAAGSMGPKVEAVCRFAEQTGGQGVIGALDDLVALAAGTAGTRVTAL
jgi:carbamate kinase